MNGCGVRAHHGMCLAFFEGKGYSDEFTEHMGKIQQFLAGNPEVCIIAQTDVICGPCPNNKDGICSSSEKVAEYDKKVLSLCGIREGGRISWAAFEKLVRERILESGRRQEICGDCQWDFICSKKETY